MPYPILLDPDRRLRQENREVDEITDDLVMMLDKMYETMVVHDGIGIAAPQVGKNIQVAIVELDEAERFEMINPTIIAKKGSTIDVEGCLSIPHVYGTVKRADLITVRFYNREGDELEVEADGYLSRAIQHEIDHLHGILFTDKVIDYVKEEDLEAYMEAHEDD